MERLLISGYKPHLALLDWYNEGRTEGAGPYS